MPGNLLHVSASIQCPHAASASIVSTNTRVKVGGMAVATVSDTTTVSGCPFQVPVGAGTKPQPCVTVQWSMPATRVTVNGVAPLIQTSMGLAQSAEKIPQGPISIVSVQTRVTAT